ncbi:hypothetical protein F4782DRAFT_218647 [Xylaria castorea]|nr:hypothetical protein F4782DRAFT_218647 [Xylaria castorea]
MADFGNCTWTDRHRSSSACVYCSYIWNTLVKHLFAIKSTLRYKILQDLLEFLSSHRLPLFQQRCGVWGSYIIRYIDRDQVQRCPLFSPIDVKYLQRRRYVFGLEHVSWPGAIFLVPEDCDAIIGQDVLDRIVSSGDPCLSSINPPVHSFTSLVGFVLLVCVCLLLALGSSATVPSHFSSSCLSCLLFSWPPFAAYSYALGLSCDLLPLRSSSQPSAR